MSQKNGNKSVNTMAKQAMRAAVNEVIRDRARTNDPVYVWKQGKVAAIPAKSLLKK